MPDSDDHDFRPFIEANRWTTAKVPDHPHQYVVSHLSTDPEEHFRMVQWVNATGTPGRYTFGGRTYSYKYARVGPHLYWVSRGAGRRLILNRRPVDGPAPGAEAPEQLRLTD